MGKTPDTGVRTLQTATISDASSGENTIVSAVTGFRIRVCGIVVNASGTVNLVWRDGASGTDLSGDMNFQAREGYTAFLPPPSFLFETTAGNALILNLSGAVAVDGWITYWSTDP